MKALSRDVSSNRRKLLIGAVAAGAATALFPAIAGTSGTAAEVKKAIDDFFDAARQRKWDEAGELLAADFHIWVGVDDVWDRAAYVDLLKQDDLDVIDMSLKDLEIGVSADGSLAWARYRAKVDATSKGERSLSRTAETIVFERQGEERWLIRHIQVSLTSVVG